MIGDVCKPQTTEGEGSKHYLLLGSRHFRRSGMENSFRLKCAQRGYTVTEVYWAFYTEYGYPSHINRFRVATSDKDNKSEREKQITADAERLLARMPNKLKKPGGDTFARRVRAKGLTLKRVWEHYQATHDKKYSLTAFIRAVERPGAPYEAALLAEAERCLIEMTTGEGNA